MSKNRQLLLLAGVTEFAALVTFGVRIRPFAKSQEFKLVEFKLFTCIPKIVVLVGSPLIWESIRKESFPK